MMKRILIAIVSMCLIIISGLFSVTATASNTTGGSIGIPTEFDSVDELLRYIVNEQWESELWYDSSQKYTKLDYLKRMGSELFLPVGYTKEDIAKIRIDDVMVWIYLTDGKHLDYWFTEYVSHEKPTKVCTPTEFRLLPGTDGVFDIPKVYNIFEADESETAITITEPAESGKAEMEIEDIVENVDFQNSST